MQKIDASNRIESHVESPNKIRSRCFHMRFESISLQVKPHHAECSAGPAPDRSGRPHADTCARVTVRLGASHRHGGAKNHKPTVSVDPGESFPSNLPGQDIDASYATNRPLEDVKQAYISSFNWIDDMYSSRSYFEGRSKGRGSA